MKAIKQSEACSYLEKLLVERGYSIPSCKTANQWVVFEYKGKQIGVDPKAGVWIRELEGEWYCLAVPCSVSGAIQAVEFLTNEEARPV